MPVRAQAVTMHFFATNSDGPVTGQDYTTLTLKVVKDGTVGAVSASPTEVDSTNAPGIYKVALTAAENTADVVTLCGKSTTSGVTVSPSTWTNISNVTAIDGLDMAPTHTGTVKAGTTAGAIQLVNIVGETALSTVDNFYRDRFMLFVTGNIAGQARRCGSWTGATLTASTDGDCTNVPDTGSIIRFR